MTGNHRSAEGEISSSFEFLICILSLVLMQMKHPFCSKNLKDHSKIIVQKPEIAIVIKL